MAQRKIKSIEGLEGTYYNGYLSALHMVLVALELWHPSDVKVDEVSEI